MSKRCIFCGGPKITKEHLFSKPIRRLFTKEVFIISQKTVNYGIRNGTKTIHELKGRRSADISCNCVCSKCNNGWMSQLDLDVAQIISILLSRKQSGISQNDCKILTTWLEKIAIVVDYMMSDPLVYSDKERKLFKTHMQPHNFTEAYGGWMLELSDYSNLLPTAKGLAQSSYPVIGQNPADSIVLLIPIDRFLFILYHVSHVKVPRMQANPGPSLLKFWGNQGGIQTLLLSCIADSDIALFLNAPVIAKELKEKVINNFRKAGIEKVKAIGKDKYVIYLGNANRTACVQLLLTASDREMTLRNYFGSNVLKRLRAGSSLLGEENEANVAWADRTPTERGKHAAWFFTTILKGVEVRDRIDLEEKMTGAKPSTEKLQQIADAHFGTKAKTKVEIHSGIN